MANKYLRKYLTPSANTETTIYTAPDANTGVLSSLRATNRNASTTALTVNIYPGGGATAYCLLKAYALPSNQTMDILSGVPCVLETGDIIKVTSTQTTVDFYLSYLEMDRS
jgi:hypothetical protein